MKSIIAFLFTLCFCSSLFAQAQQHITPPSTCVTSEFLVDLNSQGEFLCTSTNTWTYLPISTLVYTLVNVPNGVAGLDSTGHVPAMYLPSQAVGSAAFSALTGSPTSNAALASILSTFVTGPSSSTVGHVACFASTAGVILEDCGVLPSGGGSTSFASITGSPTSNTALATALAALVVGPSSSTVGHVACFNSTSGVLLEDCGAFPATVTPTFAALTGSPSSNSALAAILSTFVTGPSSSTIGHVACFNSTVGLVLEDCGVLPSGGSTSFPSTPGVAGEYALIAFDSGTATNSYSAVKVNPLPSCASMSSGVLSGPCITSSGASSYFQYVDRESANLTLPSTDVGALVVINGASTVSLPQCGTGLYTAGSSVDFVNYSSSVSSTVASTASTIGAGSTSRTIAATTGSGASIVYHGFTALCNAAGNYDVKNVY